MSAFSWYSQVSAETDDAQVGRDIVGIKFTAGVLSTHLPAVSADQLLLPAPYELRVLAQPPKWPRRLPLSKFKIWTLPAAAGSVDSAASSSADPAAAGAALHSRAESPVVGGMEAGSRPVSSLSGLSKVGTAEGAVPAASPRGKTPRGRSASTAANSRPASALVASPPEDAAARYVALPCMACMTLKHRCHVCEFNVVACIYAHSFTADSACMVHTAAHVD